jgi:hypothetical protein
LGYKQLLTHGVVDAGCLAHSRRKFFDLYANHQSQIAEVALPFYSHLYQIEKRATAAIAKAIDYSVSRWEALMRFLDDGDIPLNSNSVSTGELNMTLPVGY